MCRVGASGSLEPSKETWGSLVCRWQDGSPCVPAARRPEFVSTPPQKHSVKTAWLCEFIGGKMRLGVLKPSWDHEILYRRGLKEAISLKEVLMTPGSKVCQQTGSFIWIVGRSRLPWEMLTGTQDLTHLVGPRSLTSSDWDWVSIALDGPISVLDFNDSLFHWLAVSSKTCHYLWKCTAD